MKKLLVLAFLFSLQCCLAQVAAKDYTSKEFGWTIKIPQELTLLSSDQQDKLRDNGVDLVEKAYDIDDLEDQLIPTTTLFAARRGVGDYMEANYQSFNPAVDGDYKETIEGVAEMLYQTLLSQMPKAKIDKSITTENIKGKVFYKVSFVLSMHDKIIMNMIMYQRLFGKKNFSFNTVYVDNKLGELMLNSFKNSTFK